MIDTILSFKNVNKTMNGKKVLYNINIDLPKNKFVVIMGPSGSGKTTFLNLASGLEKPTRGKVFIKNTEISRLKEPKLTKFRRKEIGYIFQEYNLIPYLNVKENILIIQTLQKQKITKNKLHEIIEKVNLEDYRKTQVTNLSGGQKQRVAIARSLIGRNDLIFADEPTGALDVKTRNEIITLLKEVCYEYGKSLFMVTHDPAVANYADMILFLSEGQIVDIFQKDQINLDAIFKKLMELK